MKSLFTKDEKKTAKANYKNSLKNSFQHLKERAELVSHLVKQDLPNWNIKLNLIK